MTGITFGYTLWQWENGKEESESLNYLYIPQRNDNRFSYEFHHDRIHATYDIYGWLEKTTEEGEATEEWGIIERYHDTFDFSEQPDGQADDISTALPINPIYEARRINGTLAIKLLYFHGPKATEKERFPTWKEVE